MGKALIRNRKYRVVLILILLLFSWVIADAQDADPFSYHTNIRPSATAYEMVRHGKIEPSLYTGEMRFSLPIYTYQDPDFTIPISLEYSFNGYKPSQGSGQVGLGWTLNYGGSLTREVVGLPDEYVNGLVKGFFRLAMTGDGYGIRDVVSNGYFSQTNILCQTSPCLPRDIPASIFFGSEPFVSAHTEYFNNPLSGPFFDTASDVYSFTLPDGTSGKFIIQANGGICVYDSNVPEGEVSVKMEMYNYGEQKVWITTADGYTYQFGDHWNYMDYSVSDRDDSWNAPLFIFSSLRLAKIKAPNGRTASFSYDTSSNYGFSYVGAFYYGYSSVYSSLGPSDDYLISIDQGIPAHYQCTISPILNSISVDGVEAVHFNYLDKAYDEYGVNACNSVSINYEQLRNAIPGVAGYPFNQKNRLSSIWIHNDAGQTIDSVTLFHSYTSSASGHSPKMLLSSVSGNAGTYRFSYNKASSSSLYPPTDCIATDHWGYWRGTGGELVFNSSTAGRQKETLYNFGDEHQRDPDSTYTSYGALNCIVYPSGGKSLIEYEQNRVSKRLDINLTNGYSNSYFVEDCQSYPVGGLRVHKITSMANSVGSFEESTIYDYESSGILLKMPRYLIYAKAKLTFTHSVSLNTSIRYLYMNVFSNDGATSLHGKDHIGYSMVKSIFNDGSSAETAFLDYIQFPDVYLPDFYCFDTDENYTKEFFSTGDPPCAQILEDDYISYNVRQATSADTYRNAALLDYLVCDRSGLRGRPKLQTIKDSSGSIIRKTSYSYHLETKDYQKSLINCYSHFMVGRREFVQLRLDAVINEEYLLGGGSLSDTTFYAYNDLGQQTVVEKRGFDGDIRRSRMRYEHEADTTALRANVSDVVTTRLFSGGVAPLEYITSLNHFDYDTDSARRHLPIKACTYGKTLPWIPTVSSGDTLWFSPIAPCDTLVRTLSYDAKHRPSVLSLPGNAYQSFVWDSIGRYVLSREENGPAMKSFYTWKDMVGLTRKTDPTLRSEWYGYDEKNRLAEVRRADSVKVTAYDYHLWCEDSTAGPSYTKQTTWRTSGKNNREIVYYDGLGYPIQKVRTSTQTTGGHIVTPIRYDALRRDDVKAYLPYEALSSNYDSTDSTQQSLYYKFRYGNGEVYPFAEKEYGTSPAGRLLSVRKPGKAYADSAKRIVYEYRTNTLADSILNLYATVDTLPKLKVGSGYLPSGKLLLTKTTDEDGCTSEVFTNSTGRTVLARQRSGGARLDTYYVYDLRDSLVCVLQPEGAARITLGSVHDILRPTGINSADTIPQIGSLLSEYAFLYAYDSHGRLVAKKLPGAAAEEFIPDDRGRTILSRNGNLRTAGKWLYNEYDSYDALLRSSLISANVGLDTLRKAARGQVDIIYPDTTWMWPYYYPQDQEIVLYGRTAILAAGDSLFTPELDYTGNVESAGNDPILGRYIVFEMERYYVGASAVGFPDGETTVVNWPGFFAAAITDSTLLEEHRYDRGDSPAVPAALAFSPVTGIVSQGDLGSTRNLELWQRQLLLPPGRTVPGDMLCYVERAFYYDTPGNTVQTVERNALGGISRTSAKYDYLGNVLSSEESHAAGPAATADRIRKTFAYDNQGKVATETASLPGRDTASTLFSYDIFGRLTNCGYQGEEDLYGLWEDLSYDIRGRLLSKEVFRIAPLGNPSGGIPGGEEDEEPEEPEEDETQLVFSQYLRYHSPLKAASQRRWNGLISEIEHQRTDTGTVITNGYFYDHAGRLTDHIRYDGSSQTNKYTERDLSFDRNGNILSLKRYGTSVAAPQDNLAYTYEGNKLMQLNGSTYQYDANGNMTHDGRRGLDLSWNHLNLPSSICSDEDEDALVNYTYLTDGTKVITQQPATGEGYAYLGSATYKRVNNVWTLESVPFTGGRFIANSTGGMDEYRYITDHLGSTRVIVTGNDYHEVEHNDYYPFGMRIADNSLPTVAANRWRFSGKEVQTLGNIGLVDFGARLYDSFRGQWPTQDALTENYYGLSPYSYCTDNPISFVDKKGLYLETAWDVFNISLDAESLASNIKNKKVGSAIIDGVSLILDLAAVALPIPGGVGSGVKAVREVRAAKKADSIGTSAAKSATKGATKASNATKKTSRAARREAMRKEGIPTSQQPKTQTKNQSGSEYRYDVPDSYGGTIEKSVQQQTLDNTHTDDPHWEAGQTKTQDGMTRFNQYGFPKLKSNKTKVNYQP